MTLVILRASKRSCARLSLVGLTDPVARHKLEFLFRVIQNRRFEVVADFAPLRALFGAFTTSAMSSVITIRFEMVIF